MLHIVYLNGIVHQESNQNIFKFDNKLIHYISTNPMKSINPSQKPIQRDKEKSEYILGEGYIIFHIEDDPSCCIYTKRVRTAEPTFVLTPSSTIFYIHLYNDNDNSKYYKNEYEFLYACRSHEESKQLLLLW